MLALNFVVVTIKRLILFCIFAVVAWHLTASLTPGHSYGKVLVYVSEQPSILSVDRQHYSITPQMSSPLVCELAPGRHVLRLERNGQKIYEQTFDVEERCEQTLFAPGRTGTPLAPTIASPAPAGAPVHPPAIPVHRTAFHEPSTDVIQPASAAN